LAGPGKIPSLKPNTQMQDVLGTISVVIAGIDVACAILTAVGAL